MKTEKQAIRELKQFKSTIEKDGRTKMCFFYDSSDCSDDIILAHSLQKNGVLDLIEGEIDSNMIVYSFQKMSTNAFGQYTGFEKIGKGVASTFFGFCGKHDTLIFNPIENNAVEISKNEHKFLLCYRALAREYHRKMEQMKSYINSDVFKSALSEKDRLSAIKGSETAKNELENHKTFFNSLLKDQNYDELRYFFHVVNYCVPIACSTIISPKFYLNNELFNFAESEEEEYEQIYLTILPTKDQTIILYACRPDQIKSMRFIDDLEELEINDLEHVTCSLMIYEVENAFLSPEIYEMLDEKEKIRLIEAIEISDKVGPMIGEFYHIGFNFFEERFKKTENNNALDVQTH